MTTILYTRTFKQVFAACLRRFPTQVTFAVPYIGLPLGWPTAVGFFRHLAAVGSDITVITRPPGNETGTLDVHSAELIEQLGVSLFVRKRLHSKVYQFTFQEGDRRAFVGSANLSRGGFKRNDETVAYFQDRSLNDAVAAELRRLSGPGAIPYSLSHTRNI